MIEKCDFCIGGKCVDSADEVSCGWAEGERWIECEWSVFDRFDEGEATRIAKENRKNGCSVPNDETGPDGGAGNQTPAEKAGRVCDWLINGVMCCDDGGRCRNCRFRFMDLYAKKTGYYVFHSAL